jgi:hypothetical protein
MEQKKAKGFEQKVAKEAKTDLDWVSGVLS